MKVFLAGLASSSDICEYNPPKYMLESFYYYKKWEDNIINRVDEFMLDSGAFTFCTSKKSSSPDFDSYLERYAEFINERDVKYFFELDVDNIVGYEKVVKYRRRLESLTAKQPIPVWHFSRGKDEFLSHCEEYPYVAIGGYVACIENGDKRSILYRRSFPWFIDAAHERGAKIHGLGITTTGLFDRCRFDSVDSTTWTVGASIGNLCFFNGRYMRQWRASENGKVKIGTPESERALREHNYNEWLKFQKYAEVHF